MTSPQISTEAFITSQLENTPQLLLTLAGITLLLLLIRLVDRRDTPFLFRFIVLLVVIPSFLLWAVGLARLELPLLCVGIATFNLVLAEIYTLLNSGASTLSLWFGLIENWKEERREARATSQASEAVE